MASVVQFGVAAREHVNVSLYDILYIYSASSLLSELSIHHDDVSHTRRPFPDLPVP